MADSHNTIRRLEELSSGKTVLHRINPSSHLAVTLIFLFTVISFGKYSLSPLLPFFIYPAVMILLGDIPFFLLFRALLPVLPFIVFLGAANPFFDTRGYEIFPGYSINAGWISALTMILRAFLSVSAGLLMMAVIGMPGLIRALEKARVSRLFITLLAFTYRYIHVLQNEARSVILAYRLRASGRKGVGLRDWGPLGGQWFIRTSKRAERIHNAISCRGSLETGFLAHREDKAVWTDYTWTVLWAAYFMICRFVDFPLLLGRWMTGGGL